MRAWNKWFLIFIVIVLGLSLWFMFPTGGDTAKRSLELLQTNGAVSGTVKDLPAKDTSDGQAVANLSVKLSDANGVPADTTTDSSGAFSFTGVKPGDYKLEIARENYDAISYSFTVDPGEQLSLNLNSIPSNVSVKGNVTNAISGEPVNGASVLVQEKDSTDTTTVTADSLGHYGLTLTKSATYLINAGATDYQSGEQISLEFKGDAVTQSFTLQPKPGTISGTVTDLAGTPLTGATLKLTSGDTSVAEATSGNDGTYSLADVPQGSYTLTITNEAYSDKIIPVQLPLKQSNGLYTFAVKQDVLLCPPNISISGFVVDSNAKSAIGGVTVTVRKKDLSIVAKTVTDQSGYFEIGGLPKKTTLRVNVSKTGYSTVSGSSAKVRLERKGFKFGLDLKGGSHLVYEADLSQKDPSMSDKQVMDALKHKIERRINSYGVAEPTIQKLGNNRLLVQLPGVKDVNEAIKLIGSTAQLDFREQKLDSSGSPVLDDKGNNVWVIATGTGEDGQKIELTGKYFKGNVHWEYSTNSSSNYYNEPTVAFEWKSEAAPAFSEVTSRLIGKPLGIFLDNKLISAPKVESAITEGKGIITGLTLKEAKDLTIQLNSGALDVPVKLVQQQSIDASLGSSSLNKSLAAGLLGFGLILLFMIVYYRVPGVLAVTALLIYSVIVLAIFRLIPVTLTLPGIAGFVISIGMAVDANILVFERMKEELRAGRNLNSAVEEGFNRAWPSIRDSNISTFITCIILYWFGGTFGAYMVRGFALTLFIGVAVSMFSALMVTRSFLRLLVSSGRIKSLAAYGINTQEMAEPVADSPDTTKKVHKVTNFVGKRYWYFLLSAIIIIPGIFSLIFFQLKPGVDFNGGTAVTFHFEGPTHMKEDKVRQDLKDLGYDEATVQRTSNGDYFVRIREINLEQKTKLVDDLQTKTGDVVTTPDYYTASPSVASKTTRAAFIAVAIAAICILLYITLAFRKMPNPFRWGTCAFIALAHDVLVVVGIFSLLGWIAGVEVDALFITGLLTVVGYSVHDTIVVFDRIRENKTKGTVKGFEETVNFSISETLIRSLATSFTVFIVVLALFLVGGASIHYFTLILLIGVVTGTYSSIFNASMLLVVWENHELGSKIKRLWSRKADAEA